MVLSNLKLFVRGLLKHKVLTGLNVLGLSVGMASALLILLYVLDELAYDSQHPDAERIVRVSSFLVGIEQGGRVPIASASPQVGPLLAENFPEVEAFTRLAREPLYLSVGEVGYHEDGIRFVDANFFEFFHFDWLAGDAASALRAPDSIVVSESLARRHFGDAPALGRQLRLGEGTILTVTGLIRDLKRNTHLEGEAFVSMNTLEGLLAPQAMENWFTNRFQTYLRLRAGVSLAAVQTELHDFIERSMPPEAQRLYDPDSLALRDVHLQGARAGSRRGGSAQTIAALSAVCAALLLVACINFVNLATAKSAERGKAIALRKLLGARRPQLVRQHLGETALLVLFALVLALGITELSLPLLNGFSNKTLSLSGDALLLLLLGGLAMALVLLAGAYPALYLAAHKPADLLKSAPKRGPGARLRDLLVVLQFAISIVLLVATAVIHLQVRYGKQGDLGFERDRILVIENALGPAWAVTKERLLSSAAATEVSAAMNRPFRPLATSLGARHEGGDPSGENLSFLMVDFDYFEVVEAELLAGRTFDSARGDRQAQPSAEQPHTGAAFVVNRALVEKLGWTPDDALGKWFELNWSSDFAWSVRGEVVGVVEDMRVDSLHHQVPPLLYLVPESSAAFAFAFLKMRAEDVADSLRRIDELWRELHPQQAINRYFLDSEFQALYEAEERQAAVLATFAGLAILISCLGLFGLAAYTAERRSKEVGIRKTLGGSAWRIVLLLTGDFSRLVLIANVIAWPLSYVLMQRWLANFAYRIDLSPLIFVGSGAIALCIAWVTVGGTAARAASMKPVLALRYE